MLRGNEMIPDRRCGDVNEQRHRCAAPEEIERRTRLCTLVIPVALFLLLPGCGGSQMTISLKGDKLSLNTCGRNEVHPVSIFVYQLKNDTGFRHSTSESFWRDDVKAIGREDLLDKRQITVHPGESVRLALDINKATKYLGVAADFCKPDKEGWRYVYTLESASGDLSLLITERLMLNRK